MADDKNKKDKTGGLAGEVLGEVAEFGLHALGYEGLKKLFAHFSVAASKKVIEHAQEKIPLFLGLKKDDEARLAALTTKLSYDQNKHLTDFLNSLLDYERNSFRYIVAYMPTEEKKVISGTDKDRKETTVNQSTAIPYLRDLAKVIAKDGIAEARRRCEAGNILGGTPLTQQALKKWAEGCVWFKKNVLEPLKAVDLADMAKRVATFVDEKADKAAELINDNINKPLQDHLDSRKNRSWIARLLWP